MVDLWDMLKIYGVHFGANNMAKLTQEQYDELKRRGLDDQKIQQLAKSKGFDLPTTEGVAGLSGVAVGFGKEIIETGREIGQLAQAGIQRGVAAISPLTLEETREKLRIKALDDTTPEGEFVSETLKAKTTAEKVGKIAANVALFFIPTSKAVQIGGRITKGAGEAVAKLGISVSAKEAPLLQAYKARFPLVERITAVLKGERLGAKPLLARETALKQGISGTETMIGVQAKRGANRVWQEVILPALKGSKVEITMKDFIDDIGKEIKKIGDPSRQRELTKAFKAFSDDFSKVGKITLEQLQKFKEGWAKFLPDKVYKGQPIAGSFREIQNMAAQLARNKIYDAVDDVSIKAAYLDYGNLKNLQLLGQKALTGAKFKGGAGSFVSGVLDMALTPIASVGGLTLYKAGKGLEFIGSAGLKTVKQIFGLSL